MDYTAPPPETTRPARRSGGREGSSLWLMYAILLLFALVILFSFWIIISVSLTSTAELRYGFRILPPRFSLEAYQYTFANMKGIWNAYGVSAVYALLGTLLAVAVMSAFAYALSRPRFQARRGLTFYVFFTMLFSGGLTPSYILIKQYLKLYDTIWVLILPGLVNCWHVMMLRTTMQSLPSSLYDSARIDGASEYRVFVSVALPLSAPALATVAFMGLLGRWNDWYTPMIYITKNSLFPIQYLLQRMLNNIQEAMNMIEFSPFASSVDVSKLPRENLRMAMMVITIFPMMLVFPLFQRFFIRGITVGSMKG
ncbi:MAG: carbohydrate ABC transporter permease [Oscillospiraceae bacterium]|nr:carbohydrate ABC transporter permease [Oscillospiraceae bacterium]